MSSHIQRIRSFQPYLLVGHNTAGTGWTTGGTVNFNYTIWPIEGRPTLQLQGSSFADFTTSATFTEWYGYTIFRTSTLPSGVANGFMNFQVNGTTTMLAIRINTDGTVTLSHGGGTQVASTGAITINTPYHVWFHYKAGSGANGIASVGFSTNAQEVVAGPNYISIVNGVGTQAVNTWDPENTENGTEIFYYSKFRLSTQQIGSYPS
jgi:hypothetical protein